MKRVYMLLFCALASSVMAQEIAQDIPSTIKQVTVFLEGAQVSRQASVQVKPGVSSLKLTGISYRILEQSIQVEASSQVKILSVSFRVNYMDEIQKPEKISMLETERRRILGLIAQEQSMQEVYREEESILKTNKNIGGAERGVDIAELKVAMDYFRQRLTEIKQQLLQIDRNIKNYQVSIGKIESQLSELSANKVQPTGEITIKVSSKTSTTTNLAVKYLVEDARWSPSYDIRAINVQSPVSITYKANVSQQSGEDWENVELTISSGNPTLVGEKPNVVPWYIGFNNVIYQSPSNSVSTMTPGASALYGSRGSNLLRGRVLDVNGSPIPGVNVVIKGTSTGAVTDAEGFYSIPANAAQTLVFSFIGYSAQEVQVGNRAQVDAILALDTQALGEVAVVGYGVQKRSDVIRALSGSVAGVSVSKVKRNIVATPVVRQTNVEFKLDDPFTIKSDGEVRATDMVEYQLDALYEYYCVPKLETDAFLVAKVLDWDEFNFLDGEASLFFEGKFIGKSVLDTKNTSDTLTLSLGRDGNVLVTREKVKDLSSKQFIGSNQKATYAYDIVVRNKKAQPITIVIEDQIPIPNTKEISVDKIEDSKGKYDEQTGSIKWRKEIAVGKSETIKLVYAVRYPKYSQMVLE